MNAAKLKKAEKRDEMRKKMLMLPLLAALALGLLLAGCGSSVSEAELKEDLAAWGVFNRIDLREENIKSVKVLHKEKNSSAHTEVLEVSAELRYGDVKGTLHCDLTYMTDGKSGRALMDVTVLDETVFEPVSEERILKDVEACGDLCLQEIGISYEHVDSVYPSGAEQYTAIVSVQGEGDLISCDLSYDISYVMGADGWEVDSCWPVERTVIPKYEVDNVQALMDTAAWLNVESSMLELTGQMPDLESGTDYISFTYSETYPYLSFTVPYEFLFVFDPDTLSWQLDSQTFAGEKECDWDLEGTWTATGEATDVRILADYDYTYSFTAVITDVGGGRYQIDYKEDPGFQHDAYYSGTVYFDTENMQFGRHSGRNRDTGPEDRWYIRSDSMGHFTNFWADALDGLYIHEDAFPSYRLTRN